MDTALLDEKKKVKAKAKAARLTVATSDARMAKQAVEMRNRRASALMADLRNKRATVATDDARLMEERRDDKMVDEFIKMSEQNNAIEQGMVKTVNLNKIIKKAGRRMSILAGRKTVATVKEEEDAEEEEEGEGQTNGEAILNMLNNALGTGLLALACTMMKVGLFLGLGMMVFSAVFNNYTLLTHVRTCRIANCDAAGATLGEVSMGRSGFYVMTVAYVISCFFGMVSYVDVSAVAMQTMLSQLSPSMKDVDELTFKIINWAIVLVPGTFIRKLGGIAMMSLVSFIGACLVLFTILSRCGVGLATGGLPPLEKIQLFPKDLQTLLSAAPVLIFCFALQAGGGIILSTLKDSSPRNQTKICSVSFFAVFILEIVVSLLGYLYFLDKTPSVILEAFPPDDPIANLGRVGVLCLVICGYVMLNVPTRVMIIQLLFNKNEALQEASCVQFLGVNICISIGCLATGIIFTDLSVVIGISGSVVTPLISFILPALFGILVRAKADDPAVETPMLSMKNCDLFVVLVAGVICWLVFNFGLVLKMSGLMITDDFQIVSAPAA